MSLSKFKIFRLTPFRLALLVTLAFLLLDRAHPKFLNLLELTAYDYKIAARSARPIPPKILIASIDEKSLTKYGRWPWPRYILADLIQTLRDLGAKSIALDIFFPEPEANASLRILQKLSKDFIPALNTYGTDPAVSSFKSTLDEEIIRSNSDAYFASTISKKKDIILGYFYFEEEKEAEERFGELGKLELDKQLELVKPSRIGAIFAHPEAPKDPFYKAPALLADIPEISKSTPNFGFVNSHRDEEDGTVRRALHVVKIGDLVLPSFALKTTSNYIGAPIIIELDKFGIHQIRFGPYNIPTDSHGKTLINYLGPSNSFPYYSVADILSGQINPKPFKDAIILVGSTATGTYDTVVTSVDSTHPGVEIHANIIANILQQDFLIRDGWTITTDKLILLFLGILLSIVLPILGAIGGMVASVFAIVAFAGYDLLYSLPRNNLHELLTPISLVVCLYLSVTALKYFTEERNRKVIEREKVQIRNAFQHYVSADVVTEILENYDQLKLGGEKKELSILFSDIRDFTTISETMKPEQIHHFLNAYLTPMTDIVFQNYGTLDKYIGDAIMAFFGAPKSLENHTHHACLSALEMVQALAELRPIWKEQGLPQIRIGIGINTGDVSVGNMGSERLFDYTVLGDSVNLASRLEGTNKVYGTKIIISEFTYNHLDDFFVCRELDRIIVKGKGKPVTIFELIGTDETVNENMIEFLGYFEKGLAGYREQQWDKAIGFFKQALVLNLKEQASHVYIKRCQYFKIEPPSHDWDGVFKFTTK